MQAAHLGQRDAIRLLWPTLAEDFQRSWWKDQLASGEEVEPPLPENLARREGDRVVLIEGPGNTWIETAAARNEPLGLYNLYMVRKRQPEWTGARKEELVAILRRSAQLGHTSALCELSYLHAADLPGSNPRDRLVAPDVRLSNTYMQRAADLGDRFAQTSWALKHSSDKSGVERNLGIVLDYARRASDQGEAFPAYLLSEAYNTGEGVEKDEIMALDYLKLAANRGYHVAATKWAHRLFYGQKMPPDESSAITLLIRTLVTDPAPRADAIALVAFAYGYGRGAPRDVGAAFKWAKWAADKGSTDAKFQMGLQYLVGQGVERDPIAGYVHVLSAAVRGHAEARIVAATCQAAGEGTARDVVTAIKEFEAVTAEGKDAVGNARFGLAMIKLGNSGAEYFDRPAAMALLAEASKVGDPGMVFLHAMLEAELLTDLPLAREKVRLALAEAVKSDVPAANGFLTRANGNLETAVDYFFQLPPEPLEEAEIARRIAELGQPVGDSAPRPIFQPPPRYPYLMMLQNREGEAVVEFTIDEAGQVIEPKLISDTHVVFGDRARATVKAWRFAPAFKDGTPVKILVSQKIEFNLDTLTNEGK